MEFYRYKFSSVLERRSMGTNKTGESFYNVVYAPEEVLIGLPLAEYPRLRIEGEMNDMPFEGALQPSKGRYYLMLSRNFIKQQSLGIGDEIDIRFNVADQNFVAVPDELRMALAENEEADALWREFTPGKMRSFATLVNSAKREQTRVARAQKVIGYILDGVNPGGR